MKDAVLILAVVLFAAAGFFAVRLIGAFLDRSLRGGRVPPSPSDRIDGKTERPAEAPRNVTDRVTDRATDRVTDRATDRATDQSGERGDVDGGGPGDR